MAGRVARLVCQRLENVAREAFDSYRDIISEIVHGKHGVYALYRHNRLHYVGLASNLRSRLTHHLKDRHQQTWDRFSVYLTASDRHLRELESLLVRIATPRGNRQIGDFPRCENLMPRFRKRMKEHAITTIDEITARAGAPRRDRTTPMAKRGTATSATERARKAWVTRRGRENRRRAILADYVEKRFPIRLTYKGKCYKATVRADGRIAFAGRLFTSPSSAAGAIVKGAADGWWAWRYKRSSGEWVRLDELRRSKTQANN